jgi:hypothetical protein
MTDAQPRPSAPSPENEYTLTIEEVAELYTTAGFPRPIRRLQKYCARGDLDCRKVETLSGEKYLITPTSVERHIALIAQTQNTSGRAQPRPDTSRRMAEESHELLTTEPAPPGAPTRPGASAVSGTAIFDHPYVKRLEREVEEFKGKFEGQVRRTEQVLETANRNLIELAQANAIAQSETLAKYMLATSTGKSAASKKGAPAPIRDVEAAAGSPNRRETSAVCRCCSFRALLVEGESPAQAGSKVRCPGACRRGLANARR